MTKCKMDKRNCDNLPSPFPFRCVTIRKKNVPCINPPVRVGEPIYYSAASGNSISQRVTNYCPAADRAWGTQAPPPFPPISLLIAFLFKTSPPEKVPHPKEYRRLLPLTHTSTLLPSMHLFFFFFSFSISHRALRGCYWAKSIEYKLQPKNG